MQNKQLDVVARLLHLLVKSNFSSQPSPAVYSPYFLSTTNRCLIVSWPCQVNGARTLKLLVIRRFCSLLWHHPTHASSLQRHRLLNETPEAEGGWGVGHLSGEERTTLAEEEVLLLFSSAGRFCVKVGERLVHLYRGSQLAKIPTPCGANVTLESYQMALSIGRQTGGGWGYWWRASAQHLPSVL